MTSKKAALIYCMDSFSVFLTHGKISRRRQKFMDEKRNIRLHFASSVVSIKLVKLVNQSTSAKDML